MMKQDDCDDSDWQKKEMKMMMIVRIKKKIKSVISERKRQNEK